MALPKRNVITPSALAGKSNGKLPDSILETIRTPGYPDIRLLKDTAARAWRAMAAHARRDGIVLSATSLMDSYRPYSVQERIFLERYTTTYRANTEIRRWNGKNWYKKPNVASAAVPGTSNHGKAIAIDNKNRSEEAIDWLLEHADEYGWSWEIQSENWHMRYFAGDNLPKTVLDFERGSNNLVEESDMIPGFDKSPEDVARATIRVLCDTHWGKGKMDANEQNMLLAIWKDKGREAMMTSLLDNAQNTA